MADNTDIYLCQVSDTVSCSACCGLYNLPNLSRATLENLLSVRTEEFASVPRTEEAIFTFMHKNKGPHRLLRPFPEFHHCPFLGYIGRANTRVGCLLHPDIPANNGIDYRSMSWYGEFACRTYFCPAHHKLAHAYKAILRQAIDNWYDFGLIVTENELLTAYFAELEDRLGRHLSPGDFERNPEAKVAFRSFARLKSIWPYRRSGAPGPCNFFFDNGCYPRPPVYRATSRIRQSPYEIMLRELDSGFSSARELGEAEQVLDDLWHQAVLALR